MATLTIKGLVTWRPLFTTSLACEDVSEFDFKHFETPAGLTLNDRVSGDRDNPVMAAGSRWRGFAVGMERLAGDMPRSSCIQICE
jgi:hypothetical protein